MATIVNLGQVSAIKIGSVAPTNTKMLWYDTTISSGINLKYYDLNLSSWQPLTSGSAIIDDNNVELTSTWSSQKIFNSISDSIKFSSDIEVSLDDDGNFGKYKNGDIILSNGKTIEQVLKDIAFKILAPEISLSATSLTREVGSSSSINLNWNVIKKTNPISSITIAGNSIVPTGNSQSGSQSVTVNNTYGVKTLNGTASDGTLSDTASIDINYTWMVFAGSILEKPLNSADVRSLPISRFDTDVNTFTYNTGIINTNFCIAIPSTKQLISVVDISNATLDITNQFNSEQISVQDAGGVNRTYTLYTQTNVIPYSANAIHRVTLA